MNRNTIIASIVFVLLLIGAVFVLRQKPERGMSRLSFAATSKDAVTRVEVTGTDPVELAKEKGVWHLKDGKLADHSAVERMIENAVGLSSSDLVTKDAGRFADLEVDDAKGAHVKLYVENHLAGDFIVGKTASMGGSYVRVGDAVYLASSVFRTTFARQRANWLERKLFDDKLEDVSRVEVQLHGQPAYALVKKDSKWGLENSTMLPKGFRFDANAAQGLVSALVNARAQDVPDNDPGDDKTQLKDGADVLTYRVNESGADGKKTEVTRELRLGATSDAKMVYARVTGKPTLWTLAEYTAKALKKTATDFRDLALMTLDASKVTELNIQDGNRRLSFVKKADGWTLANSSEKAPAGFNFDPTLVERRVSALASSRASSVAASNNLQAAGLAAPKSSVSAKTDDGKVVTLAFGITNKVDNQDMVYVRGNADAGLYLATDWTRKNLTGGLDTFNKRAAPNDTIANLDPKVLSGLPPDVRANLERQIAEKKAQQKLLDSLQKQAAQTKAKP